MSGADTSGNIDWHTLSLDDAWALRQRWDESADERLTWLETQSGVTLRDDAEAAKELWEWFLVWQTDPSSPNAAPDPAWWGEPAADAPARLRHVGLEALCTHVEQTCWARYPELVPSVNVRAKGRKRATALHEPGLAFTPNPVNGAAWPTAQMLRTGRNVLAWDAPDSARLAAWFPRWYGDIALWVENKRGAQESVPDYPSVTIERIPDDESDQIGGHRWDLSFDDDTAHEREHLIAAFMNELGELAGVDEVEHYDRGMARVAGSVGIATLRAWSSRWLAENGASR